jgi:acyl carrier protein
VATEVSDADLAFAVVRRHLQDHFEVRAEVTPATSLDELGFSSLEVIEVLVSFQETVFEVLGRGEEVVSLPSEPVPLDTVGDLVSLLLQMGWFSRDELTRLVAG